MKKIFSTLICIIFIEFTFAQNSVEQFELPKLIPPSPNAYELGKYGQIPIGMFTGAVNYNIPVYSYKTSNLTVPISLLYNSNGIKVDQIGSRVGLGWALDAGGVISRIVRDVDDQERNGFYPNEDISKGFQNNPVALQYFYDAAQGSDSEPDQFLFNFNGFSGQFLIHNDTDFVIIPHQNLKIEEFYLNSEAGFKISTPDGNKYIFVDPEITRLTLQGSTHPTPESGTSAWYLSKIIHPNGDTINFTYSGDYYSYTSGISESVDVIPAGGGCSGGEYIYATNSFPIDNIEHINRITGKKLIEISSNKPENGRIIFSYEQNNQEIAGYDYIKKISILTKADLEIESYDFSYLITGKNRIFLQTITQKDTTKRYVFDYIDPEGFPQRLSKSQDHWGYFNHKSNSTLVPRPDNSMLYYHFTDAADRSPDHNYATKGLLNKITYPTKGNTEIFYEPNTYHGEQIITPPSVYITLDTTTTGNSGWGPNNAVSKLLYSPSNQRINVGVSVAFNENGEDCNVNDTTMPGHYRAELSIKNNSTSELVQLYIINSYGSKTNIDNFFNILTPHTDCFADLEANTTYTVTLIPRFECVFCATRIDYLDQSPYTINVEIPTGGMRVQKVISDDLINLQKGITRYYYGSMNQKDISSGDNAFKPRYLAITKTLLPCPVNCAFDLLTHYILNSNSLTPLYNQANNSICYRFVTISYGGEDFENGGEEHEFIINRDVPGNSLQGENIPNAPYTNNGWNNGKEKTITLFKKNETNSKIVVQQTQNHYTADDRKFDEVYGYSIRKNYDLPCEKEIVHNCTLEETEKYFLIYNKNCDTPFPHKHIWGISGKCINYLGYPFPHNIADTLFHPCFGKAVGDTIMSPDMIDNLDIVSYKNISFWSYLDSTLTYEFDLTGQLTKTLTKKYIYENENHAQLTKVVTEDSKSQPVIDKIYYPDDILSTTSLPGISLLNNEFLAIVNLNRNNQFRIGLPIQKEHIVNGNKISTTRYLYGQYGDLVLPSITQTATNANSLENRIVFTDYDESNGNLIQAQKENDIPLSFIYGYNNTKLIAETKNAANSECDYTGFENHEDLKWEKSNWIYTDDLDKVKTGKSAIQVNGGGPSKYFELNSLSAKGHSGFKASVWAFGGTDAYIHIQVNDNFALSNRTYNPNILNPVTQVQEWNLIEVELPYVMFKDITSDTFNIKVYCGSGGVALFDDLRFYPMDAQMTTYTYEPLIGVTSISDINNKPTYYIYDTFNRLWYIKDYQGNILKKYDYHYKSQTQ